MNKKSKLSKSPKASLEEDTQGNSGGLPGWPGYRTRAGRSGYDPIDTRTEAAHSAGTIIQKLFTGKISNATALLLLGALGLVLITPLILAFLEAGNGNLLPWQAWIFLLITGFAGLGVLINFFKNLIRFFSR